MHRYGEGVLLYEPLYSYIEKLADIVSRYRDLPISISLKGASILSLKEVFDDVVFDLSSHAGVTLSLAGVAWLLAKKMAGKLYRGVRQQVGPMLMEIVMFPDAPTEDENEMIGQVVSTSMAE